MHINQLITFLEVAKRSHFRDAARQLNMTQPAVSAQIRNLEEALGTPLFYRQPVSLTPGGKSFLPYARQIAALAEAGKQAVRDTQFLLQGSITLGTSSGAALTVLPRLLRYFRGTRPEIRVSVHTLTGTQISDGIREGRLDAGIVYGSRPEADLAGQVLFYDRFSLITPPDHPLAESDYVPVDRLGEVPLISLTQDAPERQLLNRFLGERGIQPEITVELSSVEEIKRTVRFGLGVAVVPHLSLDDESDRGLRWLHISGLTNQFPVVLLHPRDRHLSSALRRFLDDIRGIYPPAWED